MSHYARVASNAWYSQDGQTHVKNLASFPTRFLTV